MNLSSKVLIFTLSMFNFLLVGCTSEKKLLYKPASTIDPNPILEIDIQDGQDPRISEQWNLKKIGVFEDISEGGNLTKGNPNVLIALLGTGISYNHDELIGHVYVNLEEFKLRAPGDKTYLDGVDDDGNGLIDDIVGWDLVDKDGFAYDRHGSGTALAGIIGARQNNSIGIFGLMSDVKLYPVRYINDSGLTTIYHLIQALTIASNQNPEVILLQSTQVKLGIDDLNFKTKKVEEIELKALGEIIDKINRKGIPIVIGAGNDNTLFGTRTIDRFIKNFENVIVITSSSEEDTLAFLANHSPQYVTTAAPGDKIVTTSLGNSYKNVSSTTAAAAHIAATLGLAISRHGKLQTNRLISTLLAENASDVVDSLKMASLGRNRLNIAKYLAALEE